MPRTDEAAAFNHDGRWRAAAFFFNIYSAIIDLSIGQQQRRSSSASDDTADGRTDGRTEKEGLAPTALFSCVASCSEFFIGGALCRAWQAEAYYSMHQHPGHGYCMKRFAVFTVSERSAFISKVKWAPIKLTSSSNSSAAPPCRRRKSLAAPFLHIARDAGGIRAQLKPLFIINKKGEAIWVMQS